MAFTSQSLTFRAPASLPGNRLATPSAGRVAFRGRGGAFPSFAAASTSVANSDADEKETKLWGGRFEEGVTDAVERFTESIFYDWQLYKYDIVGSKAHASMLASQGVPFRTSHEIVGRSVALCVSKNCQLAELQLDDLKAVHPVFEADVYEYLGVENAVNKFISYGSTGSNQVKKQLEDWRIQLGISS